MSRQLLVLAAAPVVTGISHLRVALDGDASATALGRLVTVHGTGFVVASSTAKCNVSSTDTFEGFEVSSCDIYSALTETASGGGDCHAVRVTCTCMARVEA